MEGVKSGEGVRKCDDLYDRLKEDFKGCDKLMLALEILKPSTTYDEPSDMKGVTVKIGMELLDEDATAKVKVLLVAALSIKTNTLPRFIDVLVTKVDSDKRRLDQRIPYAFNVLIAKDLDGMSTLKSEIEGMSPEGIKATLASNPDWLTKLGIDSTTLDNMGISVGDVAELSSHTSFAATHISLAVFAGLLFAL